MINKIISTISLWAIFSVLILSQQAAANVTVNIKDYYTPADIFEPSVTIINSYSESKTLEVQQRLMPEIYFPLFDVVTLNAGENATLMPRYGNAFRYVPHGLYTYVVEVSDNGTTIENISKDFYILGTPSQLNLSLKFCADSECSKTGSVFHPDEEFFVYVENPFNASIQASIAYPNGSKKGIEVNNPTKLRLEQIGGYTLDIIAQKEGYSNLTQSAVIYIAPENVTVNSISNCNANGVCDGSENYKDCPQDCSPGGTPIWIWPTAIIILAALGGAFAFRKSIRAKF